MPLKVRSHSYLSYLSYITATWQLSEMEVHKCHSLQILIFYVARDLKEKATVV
jgi:hypothetical protein